MIALLTELKLYNFINQFIHSNKIWATN